jgi:triacylglycerol esterase/lipase EstA (alpha/beta hydrolase family)
MLARVVRLSLALELAAIVALGAWLHAARGWGFAALAAGALALPLGARFALVCLTGLLGWANRSPRAPETRIGIAGVASYLARELQSLLADNLWYLPWESIALRPDPAPVAGGRVPVVLVHGYLSNRGYFRPLAHWLEAQGVGPVFAPNFPVLFTSIEHYADELHAAIERIATGCGQPQVVLVCHSMGGLAARRYRQVHGEGRIARLVTLASPHHGTALAAMGLGLNARQMRRGSGFLRDLEAAEAAQPPAIAAVSIYSPHDNLVAPQDTSLLPWARNVALPGLGHVSIIASPRAFAALRDALRG